MRKRGGTKRQVKPTPRADAYKKELSEKSFLKVKKLQEKHDIDDLIGLMKKTVISPLTLDVSEDMDIVGSGRKRRRRTRRCY